MSGAADVADVFAAAQRAIPGVYGDSPTQKGLPRVKTPPDSQGHKHAQ